MVDPDGGPYTAHTTNPVPFIATSTAPPCARAASWPTSRRPSDLLGVPTPAEMTGRDLLRGERS